MTSLYNTVYLPLAPPDDIGTIVQGQIRYSHVFSDQQGVFQSNDPVRDFITLEEREAIAQKNMWGLTHVFAPIDNILPWTDAMSGDILSSCIPSSINTCSHFPLQPTTRPIWQRRLIRRRGTLASLPEVSSYLEHREKDTTIDPEEQLLKQEVVDAEKNSMISNLEGKSVEMLRTDEIDEVLHHFELSAREGFVDNLQAHSLVNDHIHSEFPLNPTPSQQDRVPFAATSYACDPSSIFSLESATQRFENLFAGEASSSFLSSNNTSILPISPSSAFYLDKTYFSVDDKESELKEDDAVATSHDIDSIVDNVYHGEVSPSSTERHSHRRRKTRSCRSNIKSPLNLLRSSVATTSMESKSNFSVVTVSSTPLPSNSTANVERPAKVSQSKKHRNDIRAVLCKGGIIRHSCPNTKCAKHFSTSGHARRHSRIHSLIRAIECPHSNCDATFTRRDNCTQHQKSRHTSCLDIPL